jgi:DnaK suppressor protein
VKAQAKKSKPPAKAVAKPAGKPKTTAKAVTRVAKPAASKAAPAKKVTKPVAKPVVKAKAKVVNKPVTTTKARPVTKAKPAATKAPAKKITVAAKKPAPAKKAVKPIVKPAVKTAKPATKPVPKPAVASKATAKLKEKVIIKTITKAAAPVASKAAPSPAPIAAAPAPLQTPALKPGRRASLRNSSFAPPPAPMVPTHSPDAAKASYSAIAERVIAPPPHVAAKKDPKLANNWKTKAADQLTEEEVKAMPDAEYMNEKQLAFFRYKLSLLKQDIHNSAGETTEHLREDTVVVPDPADRATIEEEHALELRTRDRERKLLKKIEQSIARIDSGDYGYCDETGEAIGVGRLIARPTANLSLEAQQRRELKQKMFGD